jgi:thiamine kinase-like enzyme
MTDIETVRAAMARIPLFSDYNGPVERLGGLTNLVFRVGDHVLRIPGQGTEEYIDRKNEAAAAVAAAAAGISPEVLFCDPASGLMVTRFIAGAETMTPDSYKSRAGAPERAGRAFRRLHTSGAGFPFTFELFAMIDHYLGILSTKDVTLPLGYDDAVAQAADLRDLIAAQPVTLAPCHCDPLCENFLDDGQSMWVVDWEYSGMNDPMWDLGDLSVEAEFDATQEEALLVAYFNGEPRPEDRARMVVYKAMCDLLWTLWGLIQLANGNTADDFLAYSNRRFARCRSEMSGSGFADSVAVLRRSS